MNQKQILDFAFLSEMVTYKRQNYKRQNNQKVERSKGRISKRQNVQKVELQKGRTFKSQNFYFIFEKEENFLIFTRKIRQFLKKKFTKLHFSVEFSMERLVNYGVNEKKKRTLIYDQKYELFLIQPVVQTALRTLANKNREINVLGLKT